jgi:hypothetical protein
MLPATDNLLRDPKSELVFGLVAPVGADLETLEQDPGPGGSGGSTDKVIFEPFVGIGPRRYLDLFSMKLGDGYPLKRKVTGKTAPWDKNSNTMARVPMLPTSYLDRESQLAQLVPAVLVPTRPQEKT